MVKGEEAAVVDVDVEVDSVSEATDVTLEETLLRLLDGVDGADIAGGCGWLLLLLVVSEVLFRFGVGG